MEIDPRLRESAATGNIDALHVLIHEDPYILERIDQIPFIDTPLHIAANEGQINFAREMMNLKASFARKLNQDGFSPMHLALRNGQTELVLRLLKTDKDLVRVKGTEGKTPFHCVVTMGNSNLLVEFLEACPECIEDVTVRDETALHLALKNDHIEAFNLLIGWLQRSCHTHSSIFAFEKKLVNWKDNDDNTVLHIAAIKEQHQALKLLLDSQLWLHVKAKNSKGSTALEIIKKAERKGININVSGEDDTKIKQLKEKVTIFERIRVVGARTKNSMSVDMINTMLVVMALVITAIYQSSLSPPGGVWQGDSSGSFTSTTSNITNTNHFFPDNGYFNKSIINIFWGEESKKAGTTIMSPQWYGLFWGLNFITFVFTIILTGFLLSTFRLFLFLVFPLYLLVISYFCSMTILAPSTTWSYVNLFCVFVFESLPPLLLLLFSVLNICGKSFPQTKAEIKYRTEMRKVLRMDENV